MRRFSVPEMGRMKVTQEGAMQDMCELLTSSEVIDEYGVPQKTWSVEDTSICGLSHSSPNRYTSTEGMQDAAGGTQVAMEIRSLRLPKETVISNFGRVKITHRFGELETNPTTYEIIGDPQKGPSGLLVQIERVTL